MRITRVTTKVGDGGETFLGSGQKVSKDSLRVKTYGTVDELNSALGVAVASGLSEEVSSMVRRVQNELFVLGGDLSILETDKKSHPVAGIEPCHVERLETEVAGLQGILGPLREFVVPGGAPGAANLHMARAICRRAERLLVALARQEDVNSVAMVYLNRLSDWLFVVARHENRLKGVYEQLWTRETGAPRGPERP